MSTPLKVTAWLAAPLVGDPPHLDALCEWVVSQYAVSIERTLSGSGDPLRHQEIADCPHRSQRAPRCGAMPIPIDRVKLSDDVIVSRCSSPLFRTDYEYVDHFAMRIDAGNVGPLMAETGPQTIQHGSTATKAMFRPLRVRVVERVVWFCVAHGSQSGGTKRSPQGCLRKVLREIAGLGKKVAYGYGRVAKWEVEPFHADWSWFAPSDAGPVLMRALPRRLIELPERLQGYRESFGAVAPPYWHPERYMEIVEPC